MLTLAEGPKLIGNLQEEPIETGDWIESLLKSHYLA